MCICDSAHLHRLCILIASSFSPRVSVCVCVCVSCRRDFCSTNRRNLLMFYFTYAHLLLFVFIRNISLLVLSNIFNIVSYLCASPGTCRVCGGSFYISQFDQFCNCTAAPDSLFGGTDHAHRSVTHVISSKSQPLFCDLACSSYGQMLIEHLHSVCDDCSKKASFARVGLAQMVPPSELDIIVQGSRIHCRGSICRILHLLRRFESCRDFWLHQPKRVRLCVLDWFFTVRLNVFQFKQPCPFLKNSKYMIPF